MAWHGPRGTRQQRAWLLLGLAFLSFFVADNIWFYLVEVAHARPFPSVADVFDALTHKRVYKQAWPLAEAVAEIQRQKGRQFDPRLVEAFERVLGS